MEWTLYTAPNGHEWKLGAYHDWRVDARTTYTAVHMGTNTPLVYDVDAAAPVAAHAEARAELRRMIDDHPLGRKAA